MDTSLILIIILVALVTINLLLFFIVSDARLFLMRFLSPKKLFNSSTPELRQVSNAIGEAVIELSKKHIGALITIEMKESLSEYISKGIKIDSVMNKYVLIALFHKSTPLHDGSVIISNNRIISGSSYFPTTKKRISSELGSRHRAAIGITERTDSFALVVSETNGKISYAHGGKLTTIENNNDVVNTIFNLLIFSKDKKDKKKGSINES